MTYDAVTIPLTPAMRQATGSRIDADSAPTAREDAIALVVDLDGTLCRGDLFWDGLIALLAARPYKIGRLVGRFAAGKAALKRHVADWKPVEAEHLPYEQAVLDCIMEARGQGRPILLVSAADQRHVDAVAAHFGFFDEAVGTGGSHGPDTNLSGRAKADFLVARFGLHGFDYIGDAHADLMVWRCARRRIGVRTSGRLARAALGQGFEITSITPRPTALETLLTCVRAMRPHQWSKNVLILLPVLAAHDFSKLAIAFVAMIAFSLAASSAYIVNDLIDITVDRRHRRKRARPFAAGDLKATTGIFLAAVLMLAALIISLTLTPPAFTLILVAYCAATVAYSVWLKRKLLVDVVTLAGLYTARIVAGAAATAIALSPWLLVFSMFLFFSLATIKRQAELVDQLREHRSDAPGRAYSTDDTPVIRSMAISSGQASILVLALYVHSLSASELYAVPELIWLVCAVLFYWLSRMEILTHRGFMTDDPIVFAARDRISLMAGGLIAVITIFAVWGW